MPCDMKSVLITGGCGFVGSSLALLCKERRPDSRIVCLDNLRRRGSELNIPRLKAAGIEFLHGDVRDRADLEAAGDIDLLVECSAEPSVLAGYGASPDYVIDTNLTGAINCLELARGRGAAFVFLSTSRVYPMRVLNGLRLVETATRFELEPGQKIPGVTPNGFSEALPLEGARSLYGATKLAAELIIQEYVEMYGLRAIINRCGVLTGAWQFGKVDQGVVVLWVARHHWRKPLAYFGYGGTGKQVRDILHVADLHDLLERQIATIDDLSGQVFNVGGGRDVSVSLCELTALCQAATGNTIHIEAVPENRAADIPLYLTDNGRVTAATGWRPIRSPEAIVDEIARWIRDNQAELAGILA